MGVYMVLDKMVAHLGLHTHELLCEELGNIIAEILTAWEKSECYEEEVNYYQGIKIMIFGDDEWFWHKKLKFRKIIILN